MGYRQSWIAVKGKTPNEVRDVLGLQCTGEYEEIGESPLNGVELPSGWYLVIDQYAKLGVLDPTIASKLSAGCEAIFGEVSETIMMSWAEKYIDKRMIWSVIHDAQQGMEHLEIDGETPPHFVEIRDRLLARQQSAGGAKADVDYRFDIPVDLIFAETGYRYDQDIEGAGEEPFEVLEMISTVKTDVRVKKSWISKLFGH